MPLADYYEPFYLQSWISFTDALGLPDWKWGDGAEIKGHYAQDNSSEMRIADAQGIASLGTFITSIDNRIEEGDVIRRASDGLFLKITGKPVKSPAPAASKLQRMDAQKTEPTP